jgi:hypothetical protein
MKTLLLSTLAFSLSTFFGPSTLTAAPSPVFELKVNANGDVISSTLPSNHIVNFPSGTTLKVNGVTIAGSSTPSDASATVKGITKLSVAPVAPTAPIAVGDNDSRMTDARTPTSHASTHASAGSDPLTLAMSQITGLVSALAGKETAGAAATTQAYAIQRANHTGTQPLSTISDAGTAASKDSDTDGTLAANSDSKVSTQKAVKTYVDAHAGGAWTAKTTTYTAVSGDLLLANTSGGAFTITLPGSPSVGAVVTIVDAQGTFATNNLTVGRNSQSIGASAANMTASTNNAAFQLIFAGGSMGWQVVRYQ